MSATPAGSSVDLDAVAAALAEVMDVPTSTLETDTPLVELGLESFTAVRLRRRLREEFDLDLPLTAFLGAATVRSIADGVVEPGEASFPLTPIQSAYWVGRDPAFPLGGVATFFYREYDRTPTDAPEADLDRLGSAWNALVQRHPMLRMVVGADARQRVLDTVPRYEIPVTDLRGVDAATAERTAAELREVWSHQVRPADRWPLFDIRAVLLPDGRTRLCLGIDVLALDLAGWMQLLAEWGVLVADPSAELPAPRTTFVDVIRNRASDPEEQQRRENDRAYWAERAPSLPPGPALPVLCDIDQVRNHRFSRVSATLTPPEWAALRTSAADHGLSPTGVLLAAFGLTLARWGATEPFCLNTTLFDRPDDPELESLVGDFTSTVLVAMPELDPARWTGFADYATRANRQFWTDLDHRTVSGMEAQHAAGTTTSTPQYPVVFTSGLGLSDGDDDPAGWLGREVYGISQTPQVLLDHIVYAEGGALKLCWDSVDGVFPDGFVSGMLDAHTRLLRRLAQDPGAWTDIALGWDPSFLPAEQLECAPFGPVGSLLDDPLRAAADRCPDAPALLDSGNSLSHKELSAHAAQTAAVLAAAGVGTGDLVAVAVEKSTAQIAAILGVCASGAGYVPVEPSWPANRIASVCAQAGIRHAVVGPEVQAEWPADVTVHRLQASGALPGEVAEAAVLRPEPEDLAYVIFTSGSTGRPKGVAIEHRAARTTIDDLVDRFPISAEDRMLALSAFSFDLSVHDIFAVLGVGGALVVPDAERQRDPGHWLELMRQHEVTLWNTAPALMEMLVEYAEVDPELAREAFAPLRLVFLSADWIPVTLPDRVRALAPNAQIVSLGGATEASIWSICHPIGDVDPGWRSIPYGRALRGQVFHILDEHGRPQPVGEPGELHIGGGGLARGYVGDPQQTADRFITHPQLGLRLYRTGDMGRWRHDGTIEFLGRLDRQVKIRGHRIELGEVESVLDRLPGIRKSVALSVPGPDDRPRLVAYVVRHAAAEMTDEELRRRLRENVPEYMVPTRFVTMEEFPVTANGKIDYKALANPYQRAAVRDPAPEVTAAAVPQPDLATSQPVLSGFYAALHDATTRGLDIAISFSPGTLSPVEALSAAGEFGRHLLSAAESAGLSATERLGDGTLIELTFSRAAGDSVPAVATPLPAAASTAARAETPTAPPPSTQSRQTADAEAAIQKVFQELLKSEVDISTQFFQLGATSLTLVQAQRRLSAELDPDLTVVDFLANPTIRDLAAVIAQRAEPAPARPAPPTSSRRAARAHAAEAAR
ncbi:amino acid adenylation domain-containing protein [Saccharopolyspora sp. WRP15-2]|uniref:Phenyloxazoline synthase MbtB n=1 Tax=Saccharopolyspora oryzae TaxID=2997343 RepID=A0ABT4UXC1_9PSEU|nr:amino acid adenylation domain-containing protein [Saccharopolyspora oryzae]MDA3625742.1 amino acid adenylation domain-containing protein [Saccharopolyspora oryzae]